MFNKWIRGIIELSKLYRKKELYQKMLDTGFVEFIEDLLNRVPKKNPKEEYWNNKYPKKVITYWGRYIPNFGKYPIDIRAFFVNTSCEELQEIVRPWRDLPDDEKALKAQKWVANSIKYVSDKTEFGMNEYWCYPQELLKTRRGDCDDGAILIANLILASGVPYWKIRLAAGTVYDRLGNELGGHAYVTYYREKKDDWCALDWCFYQDSTTPIDAKPEYKDSIIYGKGEV